MINFNRHIWEGWTVQDFIDELEPQVSQIMTGGSWVEPFTTKSELETWCTHNQPSYKKRIPEVGAYFASIYNLK